MAKWRLRCVEEGSGKALLRREAVGEDLGEDRKCSQPLHVAVFTMPQTLKEWLTNEYGADLSAVTAISGVPRDVTGKFLFSRTLKSLYLPTIFALQTAETITNLNLMTPLPILRLFRPAGTLDALANCKSLTSVVVSCCMSLEGPCPRPAASQSPT